MLPSVASSVVCAALRSDDADQSGLLAVGLDADLRVVDLQRRANVANAGDRPRHLGDRLGVGVELLELVAADLDDERRGVAVGEHAGDEAARVLQASRRPGNSRVRISRARVAISACESVRSSGSENARRRKPVCGPTFGLTIALRAFCGVPMLAITISTVPSGSSCESVLPIAFSLCRRLGERDARA